MKHTHPLRPRVRQVTLREVIHVDIHSGLGVHMRELVHVTDEVTVSDGVVERTEIGNGVVRILPVGILERDRFHAEGVDQLRILLVVIEERAHAGHVLLSVHCAAIEFNEINQLVYDEVRPFVQVTAQKNWAFLEAASLQRHVRRLDEEGAVYDGQERKLHDTPRHPLFLDKTMRRNSAQKLNDFVDVVVLRAAEIFDGELYGAAPRLALRQRTPWHVGCAALHYRLVELVATERREEV